MTTQAMQVSVYGTKGDSFVKTNTDDAWAEAVNPDSLSLYQILKGQQLSGFSGSYTAGAGAFRIRNRNTNIVKAQHFLNIITEEVYQSFDRPVVVEQDDILEVFSVAVTT